MDLWFTAWIGGQSLRLKNRVTMLEHEGIHVVLSRDGIILTAYRNRNCKRLPR